MAGRSSGSDMKALFVTTEKGDQSDNKKEKSNNIDKTKETKKKKNTPGNNTMSETHHQK